MSAPVARRLVDSPSQAAIGFAFAALIISAWLALHVYDVFFLRWSALSVALTPVLVSLQCWLSVGLFIVAHDCMHGSLAPFCPAINRAVGEVCLHLYAGFAYREVRESHFAHHRHPGTALDPDYNTADPRHFWRWYIAFFRRYFGLRPTLIIGSVVLLYELVLNADPINVVLFWALPSLLSSVQLFYFGTFRPHKLEDEPFSDVHRARSAAYSWPISLLTCYHFGLHHEHHRSPQVPWWRLPDVEED